jgi:mRNA interferase YafO
MLAQQLAAQGLDSAILCRHFANWKQQGEYSSYFFGKDGFNRNNTVLRHVHMLPLHDPQQKQRWDQAWRRDGRRTSDRYLFYADGGARLGYLLIYIVGDPGAHDFLSSPSSYALLQRFAQIADQFVHQ